MFDFRWYNNGAIRQLQYRVYQNVAVYAGMPSDQFKQDTAKMEWSQWKTVPEYFEPPVNAIDAALVTKLRDETDCPMMHCKKALVVCNGDFDAAKEYLRSGRLTNFQLTTMRDRIS
jgi:hypothetical protein